MSAPKLATLFVTAALSIAAGSALAQQDVYQMLEQQNQFLEQQLQNSIAAQNAAVQAAQQQGDAAIRLKMQDPVVQQAYAQHQMKAQQQGIQPYDFYTFTYYYVATRGFSGPGISDFRATEDANMRKEKSAYDAWKAAQGQTGAAIAENNAHFSANSGEFGNQLMGNSTFVAQNGATQVLPHTWQPNTYQTYNNQTYFVDQSGAYWMADPYTRRWVPLQPQQVGR